MQRPFLVTTLIRLVRDRRGNVALIFAVALVMVVLVAGAAVDFGRAAQFKTILQGDADAAALAGATAYVSATTASTATTVATNYMNAGIPLLPPNTGVTFTVTPGTLTSGGQTSGYTVAVAATGQVQTTLLGIFMRSVAVSVGSKAENPVVTALVDLGDSLFCACDGNTIYAYQIPSDNSLPQTSALTQIFSNVGASSTSGCVTGTTSGSSATFTVAASQKIGFALQNVTGENCLYGANGYGAAQGSTQYFYTQLNPPSADAYPTVTQDCSIEVATVTGGTYPANAPTSGSCLSATPANATPSCQSLGGSTLRFYWNDMGGAQDDYDFNDAEYNFSCSGTGTGPTSVFVMQ